jgi:hypothetical protein
MSGIYVNNVSATFGQLKALQSLRMLAPSSRAQGMNLLELPPETAQLAMSLQRISFCSKAVPLELTALQSLSRLSICGLAWNVEVGTQVWF